MKYINTVNNSQTKKCNNDKNRTKINKKKWILYDDSQSAPTLTSNSTSTCDTSHNKYPSFPTSHTITINGSCSFCNHSFFHSDTCPSRDTNPVSSSKFLSIKTTFIFRF